MTTYQQISANKRRSFFLIILFILFILFLGWIFSSALQYGPDAFVFAVVIALMMSLVSYFSGDRIALWTAGALPVEKKDNPYVYRLVENLCITAGIPLPKIYIIPDPALNAFATGRKPDTASIALTTGIIDALKNEELEGVIAHELSHIKNYDIRLMTIVIVCVGVVALFSDFFLRFSFFHGGRGRNSRSSQAGMVFMLIGIILAILSPLIAKLIQLAVSRKREFLADASAALLTRYPEGLAKALEKISKNPQVLQHANSATAHLYINNPFQNSSKKKFFTKYFSTHPPIEKRIQALRSMA